MQNTITLRLWNGSTLTVNTPYYAMNEANNWCEYYAVLGRDKIQRVCHHDEKMPTIEGIGEQEMSTCTVQCSESVYKQGYDKAMLAHDEFHLSVCPSATAPQVPLTLKEA